MSGILNFFRGTAETEIYGIKAEDIINTCSDNEIIFWDLLPGYGESLKMTIYAKDIKKIIGIFNDIKIVKHGLPTVCSGLKRRWWLIFAASFCFILFWTLSHFIWEIEVYGNENVEASRILRTLEEHGVAMGTFGLSVDSETLANHMLYDIPELSWFAINITGSRARVLVRERVAIPEVVDNRTPTVVYAEKSGIILEINVYDGTPMCSVGDTIQKGEILVSGVTGSFAGGARTEHAMAYVKARTWYQYTASMPMKTWVKEYTGNTGTRITLYAFGKQFKLFSDGAPPFKRCDLETTEEKAVLPGGSVLPMSLLKMKYREYTVKAAELSTEECSAVLKKELSEKLRKELIAGDIIAADFQVEEKNGVVTVTLRAECRERIDAVRPMTEGEIADGLKREEEKKPEW